MISACATRINGTSIRCQVIVLEKKAVGTSMTDIAMTNTTNSLMRKPTNKSSRETPPVRKYGLNWIAR